ncbi:TetR/AcrR family transcriptional regulator [Clostridium sp. OM07-10AC]|nr:TetR/AcrR family transcriptional regulator [Clostridium sp. OM07-10AC]
MKDEKETRKRLQECAMEEFLEKGFMKASLRSICKKAGVTTGALYFFFEDKDDLFVSLVKEPLAGVREAMEMHFLGEKQAMESGELLSGEVQEGEADDYRTTLNIVHELYGIVTGSVFYWSGPREAPWKA